MKKIFRLILLIPLLVLGQDNNQNWSKQLIYKTAQTAALPNSPAPTDAVANVTYFDGLGRPIQQIANRQSGDGTDLITHIQYDDFGRQAVQYLPFSLNSNSNMQFVPDAAVQTEQFAEYLHQQPYSETAYEASPLNRVLKQSAPGTTANWAMGSGHEVRQSYRANIRADKVRHFKHGDPAFTDLGIFDNNELYKNEITDENGHITESYTNIKGQLILKRALGQERTFETYYIYDDFGNLTYVVPPMANDVITPEIIEKLCYAYTYDRYNRLIKKKLPQKQPEYIIYDKLNRIVATGPAADPFGSDSDLKGWLLTRYDDLSRVAYTGWYPVTWSEQTPELLQWQYDGAVSNVSKKASNTIGSIKIFYSTDDLPPDFILLTVNYYDDYDFPGAPLSFATGLTPDDNPVYYNNTHKPRGLATGSWSRILKPGTETGETSYVLYDAWARPVVSQSDNGDADAYTRVVSALNFAGETQQVKTFHKRPGQLSVLETTEDFVYTDQGRLQEHLHKIGSGNPGNPEVLSSNNYTSLGRIKSKSTGSGPLGALQKIDYRYNIRGWLEKINNVNDLTEFQENDLFGFAISYDQLLHDFEDGAQQFNGNISETFWRSTSDNLLRQYSYRYDEINRLHKATYIKDEEVTNSYDEELDYDLNGNITHIWRNGNLDNVAPPTLAIDDLEYSYEENSNRLIGVYDLSGSTLGFKDNPQAVGGEKDYVYDDYGNLVQDGNKRIEKITYNHLNLPVSIEFLGGDKKISYIYNASGVKLQKKVADNPSVTTTDYVGIFQYRNNILQFLSTAEGYVAATVIDSVKHYNYVYHYKDHLGNIRLSYGLDENSQLKILEENHYYPYGLKHTSYNSQRRAYQEEPQAGSVALKVKPPGGTVSSDYNYKFNGQEWQDELGLNLYDMDMRDYDPAIGRWTGIDPVTHHSQSPYNAFDSNPVSIADPSGADGVGGETFSGVWGMSVSTPNNYGMYLGYVDNASFGNVSMGVELNNGWTTPNYFTNDSSEISQLYDYLSISYGRGVNSNNFNAEINAVYGNIADTQFSDEMINEYTLYDAIQSIPTLQKWYNVSNPSNEVNSKASVSSKFTGNSEALTFLKEDNKMSRSVYFKNAFASPRHLSEIILHELGHAYFNFLGHRYSTFLKHGDYISAAGSEVFAFRFANKLGGVQYKDDIWYLINQARATNQNGTYYDKIFLYN